jgi:hypothetical protein
MGKATNVIRLTWFVGSVFVTGSKTKEDFNFNGFHSHIGTCEPKYASSVHVIEL